MTVLTQKPNHAKVADVYEELILIDRLHRMPEDALLRVLRTIAPSLLKAAAAEFDSAAVDGQISTVPETLDPGSERKSQRSEARQKVLKSGSAVFNNRYSVMNVQIRDLSDNGCRIRVANAVHLPDQFNLLIQGFTTTKNCEVRWRSSTELGVSFSPPA